MQRIENFDPTNPEHIAIAAANRAERKAIMDAATPEIGEFMMFTIYLNWGWDGCGFGEFYASKNHDTGEWTIDDECMSPESVRKILHAAVDKFVDEQLKVKREAKG